ncbi:MAG: family 1 glycosylhydrolase [Streptosporangiaceae bacterium]
MEARAPRSFPPEFRWGASTAGHQVEGNNTASDTWFLENVQPTVFREPSGAACNSYELWRQDIDLVAGLGLNTYRFSVEWARVEPAEGEFSDAALAHYRAMVDYCRESGIAPVVTYNHFTAPHWFAAGGGWLDQRAPELFARYCGVVTEWLGDGVAWAVTLNEPDLPHLLSWLPIPDAVHDLERETLLAAGEKAGVPRYRVANVVLREDMDTMAEIMAAGHRAARAAIKARRPDLPVGLSLAMSDDQAVGDDTSVRDRKRAEVYGRWLELAREDDFLGVQNYTRDRYDGTGPVSPPPDAAMNQMFGEVWPPSLGGAVRYAYAAAGVPLLVTEHGLGHRDDRVRAAFIEPALAGLLDAIEDGVPVLGYLHWSLLDNFEWIFGYDVRFGLHEVDRATFARTAKPSAAVYAKIAGANAVGQSSHDG